MCFCVYLTHSFVMERAGNLLTSSGKEAGITTAAGPPVATHNSAHTLEEQTSKERLYVQSYLANT